LFSKTFHEIDKTLILKITIPIVCAAWLTPD